MTATKQTTTDAPIHGDIIDNLARQYEVDRDALAAYLAAANEQWQDFSDELREHCDVVADDDDRLIVLEGSGHETREMDKWLVGPRSDVDIDIPDEHGSRANLLRKAHDAQAKQFEADAFGGRQDAVDAVGAADAVIVSLDD